MPETDPSFANLPEARAVPRKRTRLSFVWVIPIVAAVAGVWIAATKILSTGPEITIVFSSASGLEVNKTRIEYNGLKVGTLTSLRLMADHKHVIATAAMVPKAKELLVKDTKFWVVKPRVSGLNITGLGTLISGYFIGMQIGESKESKSDFTALETPPPTGDVPGRIFLLKTEELGSLAAGTPVYFRQLPAGQVLSYELDKGGEFLNVQIFVQAPYDQYVNPDTRFWQASGIDVSLTAGGLHVQTESVMSILAGGVAFETPASDSPRPPAEAGTTFTLFGDRAEAFRPPPGDPYVYLLTFKQSVRGLAIGAPVEVGGITIGEVTEIHPQFDMNTMEFTVPVTICVDPKRYGVNFIDVLPGEDAMKTHKKVMETLVKRGLRAELKTGNLLSGSLYVAFDFVPDAPPVALNWSRNPVELPTVSGKLDALEDNVTSLIKNLNVVTVGVQGTLTNADRLLTNAGNLVAPDSAFNTELINLLQQGGGAAQSLRVLADYLERHPEALIRGKTGEAKP